MPADAWSWCPATTASPFAVCAGPMLAPASLPTHAAPAPRPSATHPPAGLLPAIISTFFDTYALPILFYFLAQVGGWLGGWPGWVGSGVVEHALKWMQLGIACPWF